MQQLWEKVQNSPDEFKDRRVSYVLSEMRKEAIDSVLSAFAEEWCVSLEAISYAADRYQIGDFELPGLNNLKKTANFDDYSAKHEGMSKFKYHQSVKKALIAVLNDDVIPLRDDDYRIDNTLAI
jgi:type I restriction enzyme R subunit